MDNALAELLRTVMITAFGLIC